MSKAKEKGNYLEEFVAKKIRDQFNLTTRDVHRAQSSGVFSTEFGDIYFRKHAIIIECKNQKAVTPTKIFPKLSKEVFNFYKQMDKDTQSFIKQYPDVKNISFLVITNSSERLPKYVLIRNTELSKAFNEKTINTSILSNEIPMMHVVYKENSDFKFFVFLLDDFVKYMNLSELEY